MKAPNHKENELNFYLLTPFQIAYWIILVMLCFVGPAFLFGAIDMNGLFLIAPCVFVINFLFGGRTILRLTKTELFYSTGPGGFRKRFPIGSIEKIDIIDDKIHLHTYTSSKPFVINLGLIPKKYHTYAQNSAVMWLSECRG